MDSAAEWRHCTAVLKAFEVVLSEIYASTVQRSALLQEDEPSSLSSSSAPAQLHAVLRCCSVSSEAEVIITIIGGAHSHSGFLANKQVLFWVRFSDEEQTVVDGHSFVLPLAQDAAAAAASSETSSIDALVAEYVGMLKSRGLKGPPPRPPPPETAPTFGVPQNFSQQRTSSTPPVQSSSTLLLPRYGQSDLIPAGAEGFPAAGGRIGGTISGSASGAAAGGMMFGPQNPIFGATTTTPAGGQAFSPDPAGNFARFDPVFPGGAGRGGAPLVPPGGGAGFGAPWFPGEPNPDHLRPFNNDELPPPFGRGGGRAGGMFGAGRGRGGFNYGW